MNIATKKRQLVESELDQLERNTRQMVEKYTRRSLALSKNWYKSASLTQLQLIIYLFLMYYIDEYGKTEPIADYPGKVKPSGWTQRVQSLYANLVDRSESGLLQLPYTQYALRCRDKCASLIRSNPSAPQHLLNSTSVVVHRNYIADSMGEEFALFLRQFIETTLCKKSHQLKLDTEQADCREKWLIEHYVCTLNPMVRVLIKNSRMGPVACGHFDVFGLAMEFEYLSSPRSDSIIKIAHRISAQIIGQVVLKRVYLLIHTFRGNTYRKNASDWSESTFMSEVIQWIHDSLDQSAHNHHHRVNFLQTAEKWIQEMIASSKSVQVGQIYNLLLTTDSRYGWTDFELLVDVQHCIHRDHTNTLLVASLVPYWHHMHQSYGACLVHSFTVPNVLQVQALWQGVDSQCAYRVARSQWDDRPYEIVQGKDKERVELINYIYSLIVEEQPKIQNILLQYITVQTVCEVVLHYL